MHLSINDITELVGGRLQFGPLPPLDNTSETVGRILPTCQHAHAKDVVLWCGQPGSESSNPDCFLEEAYMRGALGVIAARPVAPWAGRFHLQVADPHQALCRLASQLAQQAIGKRVLIVDPLAPSPVYHTMCRATRQIPSELDLTVIDDSHDSMRWQIIGLDRERTHTLLHTIELPNSDWHHWFQPDVVVFTGDLQSSTSSRTLAELVLLLNRMAAGASLVVPDFWLDEILTAGWQGETTTFGSGQVANRVLQLEGDPLMTNGSPMATQACWRSAESAAHGAIAVARAVGMEEQEFIAKWIVRGEQRAS